MLQTGCNWLAGLESREDRYRMEDIGTKPSSMSPTTTTVSLCLGAVLSATPVNCGTSSEQPVGLDVGCLRQVVWMLQPAMAEGFSAALFTTTTHQLVWIIPAETQALPGIHAHTSAPPAPEVHGRASCGRWGRPQCSGSWPAGQQPPPGS